MSEETITFFDIEIEKQKSHHYKVLLFLEDVDINNILASNKISSDEKTINTLLVTYTVIIK